jgi:hypothetical protein
MEAHMPDHRSPFAALRAALSRTTASRVTASRVTASRVNAIAPGQDGDALRRLPGPEIESLTGERPWYDLADEMGSALDAWRQNPLARRLVGLTAAYVVGDGLTLTADVPEVAAFVERFAADPANALARRQLGWCEELSRSGELFIALHTNPADGMSYVRTVPARVIARIETAEDDYETELAYQEAAAMGGDGRAWLSSAHPDAWTPDAEGRLPPVMLHFAVNRPVGALRGESDLAPILPWLRRYARWLEDRSRLNSVLHTFLWIVRVPGPRVAAKAEQYRRSPESGSVLVVDRDAETWEPLAPKLNAADAAADGRALRWMIAAGGPGVGLVDLGEAEDANLATARAMAEQRARFMRARQTYFAGCLAELAATAYNRARRAGCVTGPEISPAAVRVIAPDISPADNAELAQAAANMAQAFATLKELGLDGPEFRALALRLALKFAGEG